MTDHKYLNFTRGTTLQSLCREIMTGQQTGADLMPLCKWITDEQRNLRKKQSSLWEPTVSDCCYYSYLDILLKAISNHADSFHIQEICDEITELTRTKLYALFLTQEVSCWPSLESVFDAAQSNPDYETALVYTPFYHQNFSEQVDYYDEYRSMGLPILRHNEYDLTEQSPDIVFVIKPYAKIPERYQLKHLECVVPRAVYIPYGMEITTDLAQFGFQFYLHYKAWRHCVYGKIVKEYAKDYGYRNGENIAVWGHPKADHFRDMEAKREQIPDEWKQKIGNRKVILWTPHHLIDLNEMGTGTWLLWGEKILDMALKNPDTVFIFRPHPLMMGALLNSGAMTQLQVDRLQQRIRDAENIIWDTNSLYYAAFYAADAIITDGTTFSVEFLYTKKPILLTPRNMKGFYMYEQMLKGYYIAREMQDIVRFVQMIRAGEDPLCQHRLALYQKLFFIPETGTVGENIMKQVKHDLNVECQKVICGKLPEPKAEVPADTVESIDKAEFPLFSILVLCYKNMELLFDMLDSIFMQDYPRIQLIVSDDGSKDFDVECVQKYIDNNKRQNIEQVTIRKNPENLRTVKHIHGALNFVTGEYMSFTAADDRFSGKDTISRYVEQFLKNPRSVWLVARCKMTTADYKTTNFILPTVMDEPYFISGDARKLFSRWSRRGMAIPCCMAFRKDAFELVGGIDLNYQFSEDLPLVLKLLRNGHAPIYYNGVTAIHSTGGITNSNERYGKEIRKLFYDDKYLIFKKEVEPYKKQMFPEDRKAYKQYLKEIMARHYFFYIDWADTPIFEKIKLCIRKPIRAWWVFELKYMRIKDKIKRKKLFAVSQGMLLLALVFLNMGEHPITEWIFRFMGWLDLAAAVVLFIVSTVTYPLERYFSYKARLRTKLVN